MEKQQRHALSQIGQPIFRSLTGQGSRPTCSSWVGAGRAGQGQGANREKCNGVVLRGDIFLVEEVRQLTGPVALEAAQVFGEIKPASGLEFGLDAWLMAVSMRR